MVDVMIGLRQNNSDANLYFPKNYNKQFQAHEDMSLTLKAIL